MKRKKARHFSQRYIVLLNSKNKLVIYQAFRKLEFNEKILNFEKNKNIRCVFFSIAGFNIIINI